MIEPDGAPAAEEPTGLGQAELLADADRPGGWLLLVDRVRQSYVDLDDPTYLDFEYMQQFAEIVDALPPGPLAVTHVGGGAFTFARYLAVTRPGSPQIVLEPDAALTALVRERLPLPRVARIRVRAVDGRNGVRALKTASADILVVDAFHGGRVPAGLTTREFIADVARVLRPTGMMLINFADGPGLAYTRRVMATVRERLPQMVLVTDPGVLKYRRFSNLVLAASRDQLPLQDIQRAAARAAFPRAVTSELPGSAAPFTDSDSMRSPAPPEESWRVTDD